MSVQVCCITWEMSGIQPLCSQLGWTFVSSEVLTTLIAAKSYNCFPGNWVSWTSQFSVCKGICNWYGKFSLSTPWICLQLLFSATLIWCGPSQETFSEIKLEAGGRPAEIAFTFLGSKWQGKVCGEERSQYVKGKWMCLHRDPATDI